MVTPSSTCPRSLLRSAPWVLIPLTIAAAAVFFVRPASATVQHQTDFFTVSGKRITVERFEPRGAGERPVVVLLHGIDGMWRMGDAYRSAAGMLAGKGFVVVVPHYFDRTGTQESDVPALLKRFRRCVDPGDRPEPWEEVREPFETWLEVVRSAVRYARGRDSDEPVGLVGVSLGGYLAMSAAAEKELGVAAVANYFGGIPGPLRTSALCLPPTLLVHGDIDCTVPLREAHVVRDLFATHRLSCELKVYSGVGHVFMNENGQISWAGARALSDAEERTAVFFARHLHHPKPH